MGRYLTILWLAIAVSIGPAGAAESLVINTYAIPPLSTKEGTGFYDAVVREAGRRIGHNITIVWQPERRGIRLANGGEDDGHYPRIASVSEEFRNLIPVPVPIYRSIFVAIAKRPDVEVKGGWESLRSYSVGYPMGWKIFEKKDEHFGTSVPVASPPSLLRMVDRGRIDVALYEKTAFGLIATKEGMTHLRILEPSLNSFDLHLLLHKKHASLVPMFAAALKGMTEDGTLRKLCPPCAESILGPD